MSPTHHTVASAITSAAFYAATHSVPGTVICFLSGIFIDIDHIFDLWIHTKKLFFTYKELFNFCENYKDGKLRLIFHSYEFLAMFWLAVWYFKLGYFWQGWVIGVTVHMILDQIYNPLRPFVYFLSYRISHGFSREYTFRPDYYRKLMEK